MQVGEGFDAVELAGFDEGRDDSPAFTAAIASGKEMVFAPKCCGTNGTFDGISVEIDVTIINKTFNASGAIDSITRPSASKRLLLVNTSDVAGLSAQLARAL